MADDNEDEIARKMAADLGVPVAPKVPVAKSTTSYGYGGTSYGRKFDYDDWNSGGDGYGGRRTTYGGRFDDDDDYYSSPQQGRLFDRDGRYHSRTPGSGSPSGYQAPQRSSTPKGDLFKDQVKRASGEDEADVKVCSAALKCRDDLEVALVELVADDVGASIPGAALDDMANTLHTLISVHLDQAGVVWSSKGALILKTALKEVMRELHTQSPVAKIEEV